jgi:hypothetical protein
VWCQDNNLSLNISKTRELIVEDMKWRSEHAPVHIDEGLKWSGLRASRIYHH